MMKVIPEDIEKKLQVVLRHIEDSAAFDFVILGEGNRKSDTTCIVVS